MVLLCLTQIPEGREYNPDNFIKVPAIKEPVPMMISEIKHFVSNILLSE